MLAGMNGDPCRDVVSRPEVAEQMLLAGALPCPRCRGVLRPFGNGRTRTVREVGADTVTVTPRRARCTHCQVTQIPLPTALTVRRADSAEAIGNAPGHERPRRRTALATGDTHPAARAASARSSS